VRTAPDERHLEQLLDEALEETFPASDPPAPFHPARGDLYAPRGASGPPRSRRKPFPGSYE
jgi:hypothetical protein